MQGSQPPVLLTGLTKLEVHQDSVCVPSPAAQQSQLGRVLQGLSSLQSLTMSFVMPFQPVATALAGLTSLTHLQLSKGTGKEGAPLVLPSVQSLDVSDAWGAGLESLDAPQLRFLKAGIMYPPEDDDELESCVPAGHLSTAGT
jgi:hypothetical protein